MSKKKKDKLKLKKLIESRLKQLETQKASPDLNIQNEPKIASQKPQEKQELKKELKKIEKTENKNHLLEPEINQPTNHEAVLFKYDLLKILYIFIVIIALFLLVYYLNLKTDIFNNLSNYLFSVFTRS